jgi:CheY-like chemotaxis protein
MPGDPLRLILADDDLDDCFLFREALSELPVKTTLTIVNDGDALLNSLSLSVAEPPNLIFLDLNMPRKDGMECLREIKGTEILQKIPVVIFSTFINDGLTRTLVDLGALECIMKPSSYVELKDLILNVLRRNPVNC